MSKKLTVVISIITAVVSFCAGAGLMKVIGSKSPTAIDNPPPAGEPDEPKKDDSVIEKNVFFSPHTGSDSNDATQWSPVETFDKAKEIAKGMTLEDGEKIVYLEYLMTVDVTTQAAAGVNSVNAGGINMIPFTGKADGYYFKGETVGTGCDTQKYAPDGGVMFSARYLLKGTDCDGKQCSIFIENNGPALEKCTPMIVSDSPTLAKWSDYDLRAIVVPGGSGVSVNVYRIH